MTTRSEGLSVAPPFFRIPGTMASDGTAKPPAEPAAEPKGKGIEVYFSNTEDGCSECKKRLEEGDQICLDRGVSGSRVVLCLSCADLDRLVYLQSGHHALTRRARKHSKRDAIVYKFSRARKRKERQGVLVEKGALEQAEQECLSDADARRRSRERAKERRAKINDEYVEVFARKIAEMYPACPPDDRKAIAEHACEVGSGRVGRIAAAKELKEWPVEAAVRAHIRHNFTDYDAMLWETQDREGARVEVAGEVEDLMEEWSGGKG